jgi:hypothetical protein
MKPDHPIGAGHCPHRVLAVTDGDRYLGILRRSDVFVALLRLG